LVLGLQPSVGDYDNGLPVSVAGLGRAEEREKRTRLPLDGGQQRCYRDRIRLIAALIAIAAIAAFTSVGTSLSALFNLVAGDL